MIDPYSIFQWLSPIVILGWLALILAPLAPKLSQWVAALAIPTLLAIGYSALIALYWRGAEGGFGSLDEVMLLFDNPHITLAGWAHYLAYDLFVGAWIVRTARGEGIAHWLIVPILVPAFLFGPAGFLLFMMLRGFKRFKSRIPNS